MLLHTHRQSFFNPRYVGGKLVIKPGRFIRTFLFRGVLPKTFLVWRSIFNHPWIGKN